MLIDCRTSQSFSHKIFLKILENFIKRTHEILFLDLNKNLIQDLIQIFSCDLMLKSYNVFLTISDYIMKSTYDRAIVPGMFFLKTLFI